MNINNSRGNYSIVKPHFTTPNNLYTQTPRYIVILLKIVLVSDLGLILRKIMSPSPEPLSPNARGSSHTLCIRVCAAQQGRDFEAPDLERVIHFKGVF